MHEHQLEFAWNYCLLFQKKCALFFHPHPDTQITVPWLAFWNILICSFTSLPLAWNPLHQKEKDCNFLTDWFLTPNNEISNCPWEDTRVSIVQWHIWSEFPIIIGHIIIVWQAFLLFLLDLQVFAWGNNSMGQCGQGHCNTPITKPTKVVGLDEVPVHQIVAGTSHSLAWTALPSERYSMCTVRTYRNK